MNRRGFFGALAALLALLRGRLPLPLPGPAVLGLEAWIPPAASWEGLFRCVDRSPVRLEGFVLTRGLLIEASNRLWDADEPAKREE